MYNGNEKNTLRHEIISMIEMLPLICGVFSKRFSLFVYGCLDQHLALKIAGRLRNLPLLEQLLYGSSKRAHKHVLNPEMIKSDINFLQSIKV